MSEYLIKLSKEVDIYHKARSRIIERCSLYIFDNLQRLHNTKNYNEAIKPISKLYKEKLINKQTYNTIISQINLQVFKKIYFKGTPNPDVLNEKSQLLKRLCIISNEFGFEQTLSSKLPHYFTRAFYKKKLNSININTNLDLELLLESWLSIGLKIDLNLILDRLNIDFKKIQSVEEKSEYRLRLSKLNTFLENMNNLLENIPSFSKVELNKILNRRQKLSNLILGNIEQTDRIFHHSYLTQNKLKCSSCDSTGKITHYIPLHLGIKVGGRDNIENIRIYCDEHLNVHKLKVEPLNSIKSNYDIFQYINDNL